jgi:predicted transcriptional regulator YdeE
MTEDVLTNVPNKADNTIFGVYTDYEGDHTKPYRLIIGCRVTRTDTVPAGMTNISIPQGVYGKFIAAGEQPKSLIKEWETIWSSDIDRKYDVDFEVYGPRFFDPASQEALIYIGMKDKKPN